MRSSKKVENNLCSSCGENERYIAPGGQKSSKCRPCLNVDCKKWRDETGNRFRRYDLSREDLYYMWLYQGGRCDVCKDQITIETCHVDHDNNCCSKDITRTRRSCGECVRSLLCGSCNQGLGNFKDSTYRLEEAVKYLVRTS